MDNKSYENFLEWYDETVKAEKAEMDTLLSQVEKYLNKAFRKEA